MVYVQLEYYSGPAFYSLKGFNFAKPKREMTDNHTVVSSTVISVIYR